MRTGMLRQVAKDRWLWTSLTAVALLGFVVTVLVGGGWWSSMGWANAMLGFGLLALMGHDARKES